MNEINGVREEWNSKSNSEDLLAFYELFKSIATMEPYLEIVEEPKPKDHRFRYPCEGRTAGALLGVSTVGENKTFPEVKIHNLITRAKVVGSLVTKDGKWPHPFRLVGADCEDGIVTKIVTAKSPKTRFESLGIQCVKKGNLHDALCQRRDLRVDPFGNIDDYLERRLPDLDCRAVKICFQTYLEDPNTPGDFTHQLLPPMTTHCIYNKKDSNLKIMKMNREAGTVSGGDEVFIFCEKVDKDDIQVLFYYENPVEGNWTGYGEFGPTDVHHQIAIVLKTPKFHTTEITTEIEVQIKLKRPSDGDLSQPCSFTYVPIIRDENGIEIKRKRMQPNFEDSFDLKDNAGVVGGQTKTQMVKKKLQDTIKKRRRLSMSVAAHQSTSQSQSSPFDFPSASADSSIVKSETNIAHVIVNPPMNQETVHSFGLPIPPGYFMNSNIQPTEPDLTGRWASTFSSEGGQIIDIPLSDIPLSDVAVDDSFNALDDDQIRQLLSSAHMSNDPLLSQHNQQRDSERQSLNAAMGPSTVTDLSQCTLGQDIHWDAGQNLGAMYTVTETPPMEDTSEQNEGPDDNEFMET